jgi:hypothetical protein
MYGHLAASQTVRASAVVGASEATLLKASNLTFSSGMVLVVRISGRTAGSLAVSFLWGANSTTLTQSLGTDLNHVYTTETISYIPFSGALPPFIQMTLAPSGGFDGTVRVDLRYGTFSPSAVT